MKRKAYAKLNLGLKVIGKREDGYHELSMVMVPIDLFDSVELLPADRLTIETDKWYLPLDKHNTVYQALQIMHKTYATPLNYKVKLIKNIPTQAGLAGGSTDAACVINMLDEVHQLNLSRQQKIEVAKQIGADVPFCLFEKPALVSGIGDELSFFEITTPFHLFLIKPNFGISTKQLFQAYRLNLKQDDRLDQLLEGLKTNQYELVRRCLVNDLQVAANRVNPQIDHICHELVEFGFDQACMTGSGSVVFAITQDSSLVADAVNHFVKLYPFVKKSRIIF